MSKLLRAYDRSRVPLYIQVAAVMRQRIETGAWQPGSQISTLVELEREFQVARVTVRQAVELLREEDLLRSEQGRGTFVAERPPTRHWLKLATDWDVMVAQIKNNSVKRIRAGTAAARPSLREGEGRLAGEYVFLRSLQFKASDPYGVVSVHLARALFDRDPQAFLRRPALSVLAGLLETAPQHAHQTVVIGSADPEKADLLRIALGAPVAECRCVVTDAKGVVIYVAEITYRSDVIALHIDLLARSTARDGRTASRINSRS